MQLIGQLEPDWRSFAASKLHRHGLKVLNPLELACTQPDPGSDRDVRMALDLIDQCDAMLANLIRPSYATAMEIFYAHRKGKVVTVVGNSPFSLWVRAHSKMRFPDMERALDYLIGEQPQVDPVSWSLQYEAQLAERYEQFPPAGEHDYQFRGGDTPILVVAPHSTAFFREGEFQESDAYTGSLAALLNKVSRCHSLMSFYCCAADPMWHLQTPMHRAYADIVKAGQVGLVVFLLGAQWHESPGIQVSAYSRGTQIDDLASRLRLNLSQLEPVPADICELVPPPLVRFTRDELETPVISIKLHKRYRMPRLQPELFAKLSSLLAETIADFGVEFLKNRG